jgi:hypothetical protein
LHIPIGPWGPITTCVDSKDVFIANKAMAINPPASTTMKKPKMMTVLHVVS